MNPLQVKIQQNLQQIEEQLPNSCRLIVVSKYRTLEEIHAAYTCGHRVFAENRVQALLERYEALPQDIQWHLIGHLQTNKVKYIAPFIAMIHSVDSVKLLQTIQQEAAKNQRNIDVLIQLHVAKEETKFGMDIQEATEFFQQFQPENFPNIRICGIMAMASFTEDTNQIHREFSSVESFFKQTAQIHGSKLPHFKELSIGMSGDFAIAIQHGSTYVRIGTRVFA